MIQKSKHFFRVDDRVLKNSDLKQNEIPKNIYQHFKALRIKSGDTITFSNGLGTWATFLVSEKMGLTKQQSGLETKSPFLLHLILSPPKGDALWEALSLATQLNAESICFVRSDLSQVSEAQLNSETFKNRCLRVIQSAQQSCQRNWDCQLRVSTIPVFEYLRKIHSTEKAVFFWADESQAHKKIWGVLGFPSYRAQNAYLIIGPEGGWSEKERALIQSQPDLTNIELGPRVLRVPAAVAAGLTLLNQAYIQE